MAFYKGDVIDLIRNFVGNKITIKCLNKASITLIPKKHGSERVSNFRLISVINIIAKLIIKLMTNTLQPYISKLIAHN